MDPQNLGLFLNHLIVLGDRAVSCERTSVFSFEWYVLNLTSYVLLSRVTIEESLTLTDGTESGK